MPIELCSSHPDSSSGNTKITSAPVARSLPALARQLGGRTCCLAIDADLRVVHGRVALAIRAASRRVIDAVLLAVPATNRQVDAADERHSIIHHDQLLMVRSADDVS